VNSSLHENNSVVHSSYSIQKQTKRHSTNSKPNSVHFARGLLSCICKKTRDDCICPNVRQSLLHLSSLTKHWLIKYTLCVSFDVNLLWVKLYNTCKRFRYHFSLVSVSHRTAHWTDFTWSKPEPSTRIASIRVGYAVTDWGACGAGLRFSDTLPDRNYGRFCGLDQLMYSQPRKWAQSHSTRKKNMCHIKAVSWM